jgi:hypothetical protein
LFLLVFLTLTLLSTFAYSWPSSGMVSYRLLVDGGILLLWLLGASGYGSLLSRWVLKRETDLPPLLRFVTATAIGLGAMSLALLGLGLLGLLNGWIAWLLVLAGVGIAVAAVARSDTEENRTAIAAWLSAPAGANWLWLLAVPFVVVALVAALVPSGLMWNPGEPHGYDVVEYHLQVPREWYEAGKIIPLHHNVFSFFPFNVEMHFLLAMHLRSGPWAGMFLAQFMHGTFVLLSVLAVYGLARWKSNRAIATLAALAAATVPWLAQLAGIAYDEGGFLLFGALAIGWALRATFDEEHRIRRFILAGLLAGFACGAKLTAVPEVLLAPAIVSGVFLLLRLKRQKPKAAARHLGGIVLFGFAGLLTFSPWLIRNTVWARNPIFPEMPTLLGHGDFSEVQIERWHRAHTAQPAQQSAVARVRAFWDQVLSGWQFGFVFLPLVYLAFALAIRQPQAWFMAGVLLLLLLFWLCFTHLQSRFFILAVPVGAMLIAQCDLSYMSRLAARMAISILATLVFVQAIAGAVRLNLELLSRLYRGSAQDLVILLGYDEMGWAVPKVMDQLPPNSSIILVGDANAFWFYQIPMTRLRYRTIFDVDTTNRGVIEAWAGPPQSRGGAWMLIDPDELERFEKTYQPLPPLPASVLMHDKVYLVPPGQRAE